MNYFIYIILASFCIILAFSFYRFVLKSDTKFKVIRYYLLGSLLISMLLPLSNFAISINFPSRSIQNFDSELHNSVREANSISQNTNQEPAITQASIKSFPWAKILILTYALISAFFIIRLLKQIIILIVCFKNGTKEKFDTYTIVRNDKYQSAFSFFNWVFINKNIDRDKLEKVLHHEKIHATQFHSFDLILIELIASITWFNPIVWMYRNEIQLNNEYIADEGVLSTGMDKFKYQALLLNHVAEGRFISLSSTFNQSLIKKRIVMMTENKFNQKSGLKIVAFIPVIAFMFFGIACVNGQKKTGEEKEDIVTAVALPKMNVLYIGVNNPITVSVSEYESKSVQVTIDNGVIDGSDGHYNVKVAKPGTAVISVLVDEQLIEQYEYRVKQVPDPAPRVGKSTGGNITKEELIIAGGINVHISDFDYDLSFRIISFNLVLTESMGGAVKEYKSSSDKFSQQQLNAINALAKDDQLLISDIKAIGPDGAIRSLPPLTFIIK